MKNNNNNNCAQDVSTKNIRPFGRFKKIQIVHFTVVCLVTWPLSGSETGSDLVLIQTLCFSYVNANYLA